MTPDSFLLGSHLPNWLETSTVPLFISHRRLAKRKSLPRANTRWCLDSGGFSELSLYGRWRTSPDEYIAALRRYDQEIGNLDWCAPQDMMVEPVMLEKTGLTITQHQYATVESVVLLRYLAPELSHKIIPVLQGWQLRDYLRCIEMYKQAGIDLRQERIVGLGSVCRRQATDDIGRIVEALHDHGLRLHGFGCKTLGIQKYGRYLASADSLAWSFRGRHVQPCAHGKAKSEANCKVFALAWREKVIASIG